LSNIKDELPSNIPNDTFVGYNMRFHPIIQRIKKELSGSSIISAHVYSGQYLPEWRQERDYRHSYSAQRKKGGGVLRDLSHELDYINWIFDGWNNVKAMGGQVSHLNIRSDDVYGILISTARCPVASIQLSYVDRSFSRTIRVNTYSKTLFADVMEGKIFIDGVLEEKYDVDINSTYEMEHKALLDKKESLLRRMCTFEEGLEVMELISEVESQ